jgi:hypothetical protein
MADRRFDLTSLPSNAKIACLGKRATGKTTLVMDVIRDRTDISLIVSPPCTRTGYEDFEGFPNVHREFDASLLVDLSPGVVILEDCIYDHKTKNKKALEPVMADPGYMVIMCQQYPIKLSDRFDHFFVFHDKMPASREYLWNSFMKDHFTTREEFEAALDEYASERHDCMVVANGELSTYRAPRLP